MKPDESNRARNRQFQYRLHCRKSGGNMRSHILFAAVILAILSGTGLWASPAQHGITRPDAISIIIDRIIVPPTLDHRATAFLGLVPLKPGDVVQPFRDGAPERITKPTWFGWVDDDPQAFFEHPTRYVFIDLASGAVAIESQPWWPVLNGASLWMSEAEWRDTTLLIYSDIHLR
jgi:hypothetical protein